MAVNGTSLRGNGKGVIMYDDDGYEPYGLRPLETYAMAAVLGCGTMCIGAVLLGLLVWGLVAWL